MFYFGCFRKRINVHLFKHIKRKIYSIKQICLQKLCFLHITIEQSQDLIVGVSGSIKDFREL